FPLIAQIQMINFIIKEHIKRNLVTHFVTVKIDIPGIINRTDYILYAGSNFKKSVGAYGCSGFMIKGYIIINFRATFIYISDKFYRKHGSSVDVGFVPVANFVKIIKKGIGVSYAHAMINRNAVELFKI